MFQQTHISPERQKEQPTDVSPNQPHHHMKSTGLTLIAGSLELFSSCTTQQLQDLQHTHQPDAYILTDSNYTTANQLRQFLPDTTRSTPIIYADDTLTHEQINDVDILATSQASRLEQVADLEQDGTINTDTASVIISDILDVDTDLATLDASLRGKTKYSYHLNADALDGEYSHFSTAIRSGYYHKWGSLPVHGLEPSEESLQFLSVRVTPDQIINTEAIKESTLGLKAITGVGKHRQQSLRQHGYTTIDDVAYADEQELVKVGSIGQKTARQLINHAQAIANGTVVPVNDTPVPGRNPLFIDIETDGLNPTVVWLIGVKDPETGRYMPFTETDPDDGSNAVETFMSWFDANASHRSLIAWNGWDFDFPILREHIQRYCPHYLSTWERASKRDLLRWATELDGGNAILPGRDNKLETVATALGWEGHKTPLSGEVVARKYRAYASNPCKETELDWDLHQQYCEDDVDALITIYDALDEANRIESTISPNNVEQQTTQSSLFEEY